MSDHSAAAAASAVAAAVDAAAASVVAEGRELCLLPALTRLQHAVAALAHVQAPRGRVLHSAAVCRGSPPLSMPQVGMPCTQGRWGRRCG